MGLNLLELLNFDFPSLDVGDFKNVPESARALLLGINENILRTPYI